MLSSISCYMLAILSALHVSKYKFRCGADGTEYLCSKFISQNRSTIYIYNF